MADAVSSAAFRLPTNVKPTHYHLTFKTDLEELTFRGAGFVELDIITDTTEIVLNASDIEISDASIRRDNQVHRVSKVTLDQSKERATVVLSASIPAGTKARLYMRWRGKLTGSLKGYYYSSTEFDGQKRYYSLTQFEATSARSAFPCWDEPLLKAHFSTTMISRADTISLSNMPALSEQPINQYSSDDSSLDLLAGMFTPDEDRDGWKITKFEETPLMPTYLVAVANGPFEHLESSYASPITGKTIPLRIYATPNVIHQAQFCLDVTSKVMPIYEQTFQLAFPLPKLDILVAHDFDAGAMENWGLMTGRTSEYLYDPKKSDIAAKKRVAGTTSHECSHSWFGNLVTMAWWDNLWLKEGFATLMGEIIIIDRVFPEWKVHSEFIDDHLNSALQLDAMRSSHPIEVPVPDADQINQIFDSLSYSKAGSVLRMVSNYVGEETFLRGVAIYLAKHAWGNTVTRDLWEGIAEASGLDIPTMLENWITKIGYPVVSVSEKKDAIVVRQDRFLSTGDPSDEENQTIWHIPLSIKSVDENGHPTFDRQIVLKEREATIPLDTSKPFKLNGDTTGVYRVAYTPTRTAILGEEAARDKSVFSVEDRMGLLSDAMALGKAGTSKTSAALDLISSFKHETEQLVWSAIQTQLVDLGRVLWNQPEQVRYRFDSFCQALYKPLVERLGYEYFPDDSVDIVELRTLAISGAATAREPSVVAELQSRSKHFLETGDSSRIPNDLLQITYLTAVKNGGREEYEAVKKVFKSAPTPSAKRFSIYAMMATEDPSILQENFSLILADVQVQDIWYFFRGAVYSRLARRKIGEYLKENYGAFLKKYEGNYGVGDVVQYSFQYLTTEDDAREVEEFFKDKDVSKFDMTLSQTLDSIRANAKWLDRCKDDVTDWLSRRSGSDS